MGGGLKMAHPDISGRQPGTKEDRIREQTEKRDGHDDEGEACIQEHDGGCV